MRRSLRRFAVLALTGALLWSSMPSALADVVAKSNVIVYGDANFCLRASAGIREGDQSPGPLFFGQWHASNGCNGGPNETIWKAMYIRLWFWDGDSWLICRNWGWFYGKESLKIESWEFGNPPPCGDAWYGTTTWTYGSFADGWRGASVFSGHHWFQWPPPGPGADSAPQPPPIDPDDPLLPPLPPELLEYPPDPPAPGI